MQKVKLFWGENKTDIFLMFIVFLTGIIAFGLGRLSLFIPKNQPLQIIEPAKEYSYSAQSTSSTDSILEQKTVCKQGGAPCSIEYDKVTVSKNGSAYYFSWCSNSIKEENKIFFVSEKEAKEAGYRLAKNCQK